MLINSVQNFIPPAYLKRAFIIVSSPSGKIHQSCQVSFIFEIVQPISFLESCKYTEEFNCRRNLVFTLNVP